jgi:hypothetical protein
MKKCLFSGLLLASLLFLLSWQPVQAQLQTLDYTSSKKVDFLIKDATKTYAFTADHLDGRFNNSLRRFEFRLPLQMVRGVDTKTNINVFKSVFLPSIEQDITANDYFSLWIYLPQNFQSFEVFRNAQTLTLNGVCMIGNQSYPTPVRMQLFYSNDILKYDIMLTINTTMDKVYFTLPEGQPLQLLQVMVEESEVRINSVE